jgi:hypothetical protein
MALCKYGPELCAACREEVKRMQEKDEKLEVPQTLGSAWVREQQTWDGLRESFPDKARRIVFDNAKWNSGGAPFSPADVYVVWFCYILGGWKALVSTTIPDDTYYEVTYNKEKDEIYLDTYVKVNNVAIPQH